MSTKYIVIIEHFAKTHYFKKIKKKYKKAFHVPWKAFELMLKRFDLMRDRSETVKISDIDNEISIYKTGFKIMPNESVKSSGNRCIIARNMLKKEIRILLIYHKNDIQGSNETQWWKDMIKNNYTKYNKI